MGYKTTIHSNGSKWAGEAPDTIEKLIEVLKENTIEERFFDKWEKDRHEKPSIWKNLCPISINEPSKGEGFYGDPEGSTIFFGNFEEISHVFRIATNDPTIIEKLTPAIKANRGWELYYEKNLVKTNH